jgi:hypothetical protein
MRFGGGADTPAWRAACRAGRELGQVVSACVLPGTFPACFLPRAVASHQADVDRHELG